MTAQILASGRALAGRAVRRTIGHDVCWRRSALVSLPYPSAHWAPVWRLSLPPIIAPSQVMGTGHHRVTVLPSARPDAELDHLAMHARTIDRLYEQLMYWTSPTCSRASTYASIACGC